MSKSVSWKLVDDAIEEPKMSKYLSAPMCHEFYSNGTRKKNNKKLMRFSYLLCTELNKQLSFTGLFIIN